MIQPLGAAKTRWAVGWCEADQPSLVDDSILLPVAICVVDGKDSKAVGNKVVAELEQHHVESLLADLFEKSGRPDEILIPRSSSWSSKSWKPFAREFELKVKICRLDATDAPELLNEAMDAARRIFPIQNKRQADKLSRYSSLEIAEALAFNAHFFRNTEKRRRMLEKAIEIEPDCSAAILDLAEMDLLDGSIQQAASNFEKVISLEKDRWDKGSPEWWTDQRTRKLLRGMHGYMMANWNMGRLELAIDLALSLVEMNPTDHQGIRFLVPLLFLLADQSDTAIKYYDEYGDKYPRDMEEPGFLYGWALALFLDGRESDARKKYRQAMVRNPFIAPLLLDTPLPRADIWHPNDRAEPEYAYQFFDSFNSIWERDATAIRFLKEVYEKSSGPLQDLLALRMEMAEQQDQRYDPDYEKKWKKYLEEEKALCNALTGSEDPN